MTQKIENYGPQLNPQTTRITRSGSASESATATTGTSSVPPGDSLSLTAGAQQMQQIEQAIAETPDVDQQRVDEIRQSLADGSYRVDSQAVASKLARMEWELMQT